MSQSGQPYEAESPKRTARTHRRRPDTSDKTTDTESDPDPKPEPACRYGHADDWDWHAIPFTVAFAGFYDPCSRPECFSSGPPDANEIETVVRSCSYPTKYHRARKSADEPRDTARENSDRTTGPVTGASRFADTDTSARKPLNNITELEEGNGVSWNGQSTPLLVVEAAAEPSGTVRLRGSNGGEYSVEWRPEQARSHAVYPGIGIVTDLCRIVPANGQRERAKREAQ